ncbi:DUF3662 and FHA domain-containing protein [Corynebacterium suedekumii]|uniref:DUF3662 and FHA domain-containing protein n=1 Tax=Corynebacterium suedekumii TaxID=3049801 RepID=A0ABY8VS59_9CORY|nr:DUF3662 and FHA domain-containing protein [Corynebacterium suedekumii]WIM70999.1 DUF3662 and FHA domain-containing protein [Corynebacterium suedekumii]
MAMMARFAKLDSALQRGLDNGFAFVFGGRVVPAEIEELLKQEAEDNLAVTEFGTEAPNVYVVGVSSKDLESLSQANDHLPTGFADQMSRFCRNHGWQLAGPVVVRIAEESGLRTGQLRVSSYADGNPADSSGFDAISAGDPATDPQAAAVNKDGAVSRANVSQEENMNDHDVPTELTEVPKDPVVSLLLQDGSSRTYLVQEGSNIIGRSNDAHFRLPDTGVSRQHAEVTWDGQDAVLVDLESTNGTTVNDTPVENWLLADGDVITMGHSHIEVRIVDPNHR